MSARGNGSSGVPQDRPSGPARDGEGESPVAPPAGEGARGTFGGRLGAAGLPLERSKDLGGSVRRLASRLSPERVGVLAVVALAVVSVSNDIQVNGHRIVREVTDFLEHLIPPESCDSVDPDSVAQWREVSLRPVQPSSIQRSRADNQTDLPDIGEEYQSGLDRPAEVLWALNDGCAELL